MYSELEDDDESYPNCIEKQKYKKRGGARTNIYLVAICLLVLTNHPLHILPGLSFLRHNNRSVNGIRKTVFGGPDSHPFFTHSSRHFVGCWAQ